MHDRNVFRRLHIHAAVVGTQCYVIIIRLYGRRIVFDGLKPENRSDYHSINRSKVYNAFADLYSPWQMMIHTRARRRIVSRYPDNAIMSCFRPTAIRGMFIYLSTRRPRATRVIHDNVV